MPDAFRGTSIVFEASFVDPNGVALVVADPNTYPQVQIKDPDDTVVATSIGQNLGGGEYRFEWHVPESAAVNTPDQPWHIEWFFVTITGHTREESEAFDVVDKLESDAEERQQAYLIHDGGYCRPLIRVATQLRDAAITIKQDTAVLVAVQGVSQSDAETVRTNPQRKIRESNRGGEYVYYYETDNLTQGEYTVFWSLDESETSPIQTDVQIIRVVPDLVWHYHVDLKILIDKLQKRIGSLQGYSDSDLFSYLQMGLDIINFYPPTTNWILSEIPLEGSRGIRAALIYAAAVHALTAQQILEIELSFDHGGQSVTLGYNHDYGGVLTALQEQLNKFAEAKPQIFRLCEGVGTAGVRPKSWRQYRRVFRVGAGIGGLDSSIGIVQGIGL